MFNETPNHALQRTGPRVTPAAPPSCRLASLAHLTAQPSRHAARSLCLGSLHVLLVGPHLPAVEAPAPAADTELGR